MSMKKLRCGLLAALLLLLSGCLYQSLDELYALPAAPLDYQNLQTQINKIINDGGEAIAPVSGEKIQSVQIQDLNDDGSEEAIAFFRFSGDDRPLKISIFRQIGEEYEEAVRIEGAGTVINSIAYEELDNVPGREIIVSWQMDDAHFLAAYSVNLAQRQVVELFRTDYTDFRLMDIDSDGQMEILVLFYNAEGGGRTDCYNFQDGTITLDSTAPLTDGVSSVQEKKSGALLGGVPALFITSTLLQGEETGYVTDIFAWRNGKLKNITLDESGGKNANENIRYFYNAVGCMDIDADGVTEVPRPTALKEYKSNGSTSLFWTVEWLRFALDGTSSRLYTTYYNSQDGWYFVLPDNWAGKIFLSRNDLPGGGERGVIFSYWPDGDLLTDPTPFLTIYKLSGTNRERRAAMPGRFLLTSDSSSEVLYAAQFDPNVWPQNGLDESGIISRFHIIRNSWNTG